MADDTLKYVEERKAIAVKVSRLSDLAKIATLGASRMFILPIYRYVENGRTIYFVQTVFKDYFKLYGLPVIYYYVENGEGRKGGYILIKVDESGEQVELSSGTKPGWLAVPIIDLDGKPIFIPNDLS